MQVIVLICKDEMYSEHMILYSFEMVIHFISLTLAIHQYWYLCILCHL